MYLPPPPLQLNRDEYRKNNGIIYSNIKAVEKKGFMTLNYCVISNYSLKKLGSKACFDKRKTLSHLKLRAKKD